MLRNELSSKRREVLNVGISEAFEWKLHFCGTIQLRVADLMVEVRGIKTQCVQWDLYHYQRDGSPYTSYV